MSNTALETKQKQAPRLCGMKKLIQTLFEDGEGPSERTLWDWKAKGIIPFVQISNRVYFDSEEVRLALKSQYGHSPTA